MENLFPSAEYVRDLENVLAYYRYLHWVRYELLSFPWLLLTALSIICAAIWIKLVDRKNIMEILLFGSWVAIVGVSADEFGYEYRLWRYNYHVIAQFPHIIWIHLVMLPIAYMLIYQYSPQWRSFLKRMVIFAVAFSFIGEPFLVWINAYELLKWKYSYSLPLYILIGVVLKYIMEWLKTVKKS